VAVLYFLNKAQQFFSPKWGNALIYKDYNTGKILITFYNNVAPYQT
jgi:hypothetical protein